MSIEKFQAGIHGVLQKTRARMFGVFPDGSRFSVTTMGMEIKSLEDFAQCAKIHGCKVSLTNVSGRGSKITSNAQVAGDDAYNLIMEMRDI